METELHRWHYDYSRLAWESGFSFGSNKSRKTFDRNKIALLDIERIIRERDIPIVEKHLENILDYNIDSEELRILDPSFVKLFKLCQLSVEFLMYCKQYLDKTVVLLKSDFEKKTEENKLLQKEFGRITSENNKLKKKIKDLKMTLHYRHQLQQTLNDQITIYQCNECGKTFINNEYLNAHLKRRHNVSDYKIEDDLKDNVCQESPEHTLHTSPEHEIYKTEADRLQSEIKILKEKLNNAERYFHPDSHTSQNLSPNHGTVRIQNNSMYIECYNDIKGLQQQFELLKTMVQSELQLLKSQKLEQEKHDHWIQKVFDKLEPNKICDTTTNHNVASIDCRNSYTQTDETSDQIREDIKQQTQFDNISVEHQNSPVKVVASSKQRRPSIQKSDDRPSRFIKIVDSMTTTGNSNNMSDLQLVQEVEKKLEEKTKREIEQLGEQLTMKMSTSLNMLEERMTSFCNKLNEKATLISETPSPIPAEIGKRMKIVTVKNKPNMSKTTIDEPEYMISSKNTMETNINILTESDSVSETESNRYVLSDNEIPLEHPVLQPQTDKNAEKFIDELKSKVIEHKIFTESRKKYSDEYRKKPTSNIFISTKKKRSENLENDFQVDKPESIQKPVVQKVFAKPMKTSTTESESESSTDSESESSSEEESVKIETKLKSREQNIKSKQLPLQKRSLKRSESVPLKMVNSLSREDVLENVNSRLKKLGIDPEWNGLPSKAYKQKSEITLHQRNLIMKKSSSFATIRENILENLESKVKSLSHSTLPEFQSEVDQKPSKFKSIMSSMKTKAMHLMKPEKLPAKRTPLYKLTIQQNNPEEKLTKETSTIKESMQEKEKIPVKREKIIIKPKKMYTESDSESVKSADKYIKGKKYSKLTEHIEKSARKSISVTSLNSDLSDKSKTKSLQNFAQSISNLDSILELKKEIIAEIKNEDVTQKEEVIQNFSSSDESINEVQYLKSKPNNDIEQNEYSDNDIRAYKKGTLQKGVLKNFPSTSSLVKKKVLFDLESEGTKSEMFKTKDKPLESKKTMIKTNTFFDFDKDDDSTSATSSVFDGSKTNINNQEDKISTKAQINVTVKKFEKNNSESDFDISDLL